MPTQDRLPTGDGTLLEWGTGGAYERWQACDDPIGSPDEDTTHITADSTTGETKRNEFGFPAFNFGAVSVSSLTVHVRARRFFGDPMEIRPIIRVNGIVYDGSGTTVGDAYADLSFAWLTNPNTLAAWTVADIHGTGAAPLQRIGVAAVNLFGTARCTQVYATAAFTDAAGQPMMLRAVQCPRAGRAWHPSHPRLKEEGGRRSRRASVAPTVLWLPPLFLLPPSSFLLSRSRPRRRHGIH